MVGLMFDEKFDVIVVGGGLAGLVAATEIADAGFRDPATGDYRLAPSSVAINNGSNSSQPHGCLRGTSKRCADDQVPARPPGKTTWVRTK